MAGALVSALAVEEAAKVCCRNLDEKLVLRPQQLKAVVSIVQGRDCLCLLPTGFGKTLIFNLLGPVCDILRSKGCDFLPQKPVVVVVSPLKALITDHIRSAYEKPNLNLRAVEISASSYEDIRLLKYNILFGIPEVWLEKRWMDLLGSKEMSQNIVAIVVDEVHLVKWGATSKSSEPFRESFSRIHELRSLCQQNTPVLALTATADADYQALIVSSVCLSKTVNIISASVERPNIRLSIVRLQSKSIKCFSWIINRLRISKKSCPKVIVYCRSIKLIGWLYEQLCTALGAHRFGGLQAKPSNSLIGIYHSESSERSKSRVLQSLTVDGPVRLILASSSLGCGIDCKDVSHVVHYGPAYDLADYVQQIGRAGRNTPMQCHAVMYIYPGSCNKMVSAKMTQLIQRSNTECLRSMLYSPFASDGNTVKSMEPGHICCSFCTKSCDCGPRFCLAEFEYEDCHPVLDVHNAPTPVREVSEEDRSLVCLLLEEYVNIVCSRATYLFTPCISVSGLSQSVINQVLDHLPYINTIDYVLNSLPVSDPVVAKEIVLVCFEVFGDFEMVDMDDISLDNNFRTFSLTDLGVENLDMGSESSDSM